MNSELSHIFPEPEHTVTVVLRLHVAGEAPNSVKANANLRQILKDYPEAHCQLEVVDCLSDPLRSLKDGVLVTPTLIKASPEPVVRIVGDLRNRDEVVRALGLDQESNEE